MEHPVLRGENTRSAEKMIFAGFRQDGQKGAIKEEDE